MSRKTVPCDADVTMRASGPLAHLCPYRPEADNGSIEIVWRTVGSTFELHTLAEYLGGFADMVVSHEQLTDLIRHDLSTEPGIELVSVETAWDTAGMEVGCATSQTRAALP